MYLLHIKVFESIKVFSGVGEYIYAVLLIYSITGGNAYYAS